MWSDLPINSFRDLERFSGWPAAAAQPIGNHGLPAFAHQLRESNLAAGDIYRFPERLDVHDSEEYHVPCSFQHDSLDAYSHNVLNNDDREIRA